MAWISRATGVVNGDFGDEGESDLDVEWSGAVAPAATIDFVVMAPQTVRQTDGTFGIDGSAIYIVDNNIAPILSESYGSCEAGLGTGGNAFYNALWQQAAAQGITVVISAGDNGSAACDPAAAPANQDAATLGLAVSGIASTPYNIAMGGTDFDDVGNQSTFWNTTNSSTTALPIPASAKGYIPEKTWNDTCAAAGSTTAYTAAIINSNAGTGTDLAAGSGVPSSIYPKPSWQAGFPATADTTRDIPDVSLFSSDNGALTGGSNSFYVICQSDQDPTGGSGCNLTTTTSSANHDFLAVGGTSAATPTFAAIMALVNQQTGQRQGVANYVLYSLASTVANVCNSTTATLPNGCVFYDVTKGNNSVACVGHSPNCSNTSTAANQFGIVATTSGGSTPAFNAAAGYDLAHRAGHGKRDEFACQMGIPQPHSIRDLPHFISATLYRRLDCHSQRDGHRRGHWASRAEGCSYRRGDPAFLLDYQSIVHGQRCLRRELQFHHHVSARRFLQRCRALRRRRDVCGKRLCADGRNGGKSKTARQSRIRFCDGDWSVDHGRSERNLWLAVHLAH